MRRPVHALCVCVVVMVGIAAATFTAVSQSMNGSNPVTESGVRLERANFAGGCFWCMEAVFERIKGVKSVISGYSGGTVANPTYEQVCTGTTGHAESVQIEFDPSVVSYEDLLDVFWSSIDPTTLNRQGADEGTQYRSVIFYENREQEEAAAKSKAALAASGEYSDPIVTAIEPLKNFYKAESYHQQYYDNHRSAPYCTLVIRPKLKKLHLEK